MSAYESMIIFKSGITEEKQKALIDSLENSLQEKQAEIKDRQILGKRQLAYEINKQREGFYYLINFVTQNQRTVISSLKQFCNVNENILRALVIKKESKSE